MGAAGSPDRGLLGGWGGVGVGVDIDEGIVVNAFLLRHQEGVLCMADAHLPLSTLSLGEGLHQLTQTHTFYLHFEDTLIKSAHSTKFSRPFLRYSRKQQNIITTPA